VGRRQHRADGVLPFEAEPEIDQDAEQRDDDADDAVAGELGGDARADYLGAAEVDGIAEGVLHQRDHPLLRLVAALLALHADEHVVRRAELDHLHVAEIEGIERGADLADVGRAVLRLDLDDRAALEVDAVVQADGKEQRERDDRHHDRQRHGDNSPPHERDSGVRRKQPDQAHLRDSGQIGTAVGRVRRTHTATIRRVTRKAVKIVVMMPMASVTAKPRTGPEPR
jgi:hypothetical protein